MAHPFENKLFVFIGRPQTCSRQDARNALFSVGGVLDDRISAYTHYVVAFSGAEKTMVYSRAYYHDKYGHLVLINEKRFFAVIEGKANPPEKQQPPRISSITYALPEDPKSKIRDFAYKEKDYIIKKRLMNVEKYGANAPGGTRLITIIQHLRNHKMVIDYLVKRELLLPLDSYVPDRCKLCGKPSMVHLSDSDTGRSTALCHGCYNDMMACLNEVEMPANVPRRVAFKDSFGQKCEFDIEFLIFETGKSLTATQVGVSKRKECVWSELDAAFDEMMETLNDRIKKALSRMYMNPDGSFTGDRAIGYVAYDREHNRYNVIIDGKSYSWADLERSVSSYEGFKIAIEFCEMGEDFG